MAQRLRVHTVLAKDAHWENHLKLQILVDPMPLPSRFTYSHVYMYTHIFESHKIKSFIKDERLDKLTLIHQKTMQSLI